MRRGSVLLLFILLAATLVAEDWPQFRGVNSSGLSAAVPNRAPGKYPWLIMVFFSWMNYRSSAGMSWKCSANRWSQGGSSSHEPPALRSFPPGSNWSRP